MNLFLCILNYFLRFNIGSLCFFVDMNCVGVDENKVMGKVIFFKGLCFIGYIWWYMSYYEVLMKSE